MGQHEGGLRGCALWRWSNGKLEPQSSVNNFLRHHNINMMQGTESDVSGSVMTPQRVEIIWPFYELLSQVIMKTTVHSTYTAKDL